jgi:hypothetical protein
MEEKLTEILMSKSFSELTEMERMSYSEWFTTEEDYESLQSLFVQLEEYKKNQPSASYHKTKVALDELFDKQYHSSSFTTRIFPSNKPFYLSPIFQIAAILLLLVLLYPLSQKEVETPIQLAQNDSASEKIGKKSSKSSSSQLKIENEVKSVNNSNKRNSSSSSSQTGNSIEIGTKFEDLRLTNMPIDGLIHDESMPYSDESNEMADEVSRSEILEKVVSDYTEDLLSKPEFVKEADVFFSQRNVGKDLEQRNDKSKVKSLSENTSILALLTPIF